MAGDLNSNRITTSVVNIPDHVDYPNWRMTFDSGVIKTGYKVRIRVDVLDASNNTVTDYGSTRLIIKDAPVDPNMEVVGALHVHFNESPKVVVLP